MISQVERGHSIPSPISPPPPAPVRAPASRRPGNFRLRATVVAVAFGTVAMGGLVCRWAAYRYSHVVSADAALKGLVSYVGARVQGKVKEVLAVEGMAVRKGQVLARLEDQAFRAAVVQARSNLEQAEKEVSSTRLGIDYSRRRLTFVLSKAAADQKSALGLLHFAEATAMFKEQELTRVQRLMHRNWGKQEELNLRTSDRNAAQAQVRANQSLLEAAELSKHIAAVDLESLAAQVAGLKVLEAKVEVARGALQVAQADLDATEIVAPEDGQVVRRIVDAGGSVRIGYPILVMRLTGQIWVETWIDESSLGEVKVGSPVEVTFAARPGRVYAGKVASIGALTNTELQGAVVPLSLGQFIRPPTMIDLRVELVDAGDPLLVPGLTALVGVNKARDESGPSRFELVRTQGRALLSGLMDRAVRAAWLGATLESLPR